MTAKARRSHDEVVAKMLRADPEFVAAFLAAALEETEQPGGHQALVTALRHIAETGCFKYFGTPLVCG
jgi:DNA-binding phage protein